MNMFDAKAQAELDENLAALENSLDDTLCKLREGKYKFNGRYRHMTTKERKLPFLYTGDVAKQAGEIFARTFLNVLAARAEARKEIIEQKTVEYTSEVEDGLGSFGTGSKEERQDVFEILFADLAEWMSCAYERAYTRPYLDFHSRFARVDVLKD